MAGGWDFGGQSAATGSGVTLVEGTSFSVSDDGGGISPDAPHGVFHLDTRIVSRWRVTVDGDDIEPLAVFVREPHHATFLGRVGRRGDALESTLLVESDRYVGCGMREDIVVRNAGTEPADITLTAYVDSDFADLFAVKEGRPRGCVERAVRTGDGLLEMEAPWSEGGRGVRIRASGGVASPGAMTFREVIPAKGEWRTTIEVLPVVDGVEAPPRFPVGEPIEAAAPSVRMREWRSTTPMVWASERSLLTTLRSSQRDIGSLRIVDPDDPERTAVAAGAPWFMALFGRDSLLSAYLALGLDPRLALGTLHMLAKHQGAGDEPMTEEQPGRILHELRFGREASLALGGGNAYYGTADATPLFVMLLGELWRWGMAEEELEALLPHADRALEWVVRFGDADGDGFVEYHRRTDGGLRNQGWKDSWDGINFASGALAQPPIALCEVQGYAYAAYRARAALSEASGDQEVAGDWSARADRLKADFNERFWLPDRGWYAVGLDRDKRPIDSLTSNIGHCLWTGIVEEDRAEQVADHLLSPDMFSGWGVRTLATSMGAYNPVSYHNGSVWPHDNALLAAGLVRYGFVDHARKLAEGILAAAECFGGRLPELFAGLDRSEFPVPVAYPSACSPQAWASAAPVSLIRSLLRFDPDVPAGRLSCAPVLPDGVPSLRVSNLLLGGGRIRLSATRERVTVEGLPAGVRLVGPR